MEEELKKQIERLLVFAEHDTYRCILTTLEAGEPRKDGSYWQKFNGKWYQASPKNKIPKCNCGLDKVIKSILKIIK